MTMSRFGMINLDTGEISEEGIPVWVGKKTYVGKRFFMGFQDAFIEIARDRDITAEPRRVLDYMMGNLDFENFIQIPQSDISKNLCMKKSHVSRAMKLLCDKKILLAGPKIGRSFSYRMNPRYGWKGKVSSLKLQKNKEIAIVVDNTI